MAKRLTATEKWSDPWFCSLAIKLKMFWIYILDNCDHAGIWDPNWGLAEYHLKVSRDSNLEELMKKVVVLDSGKWFISNFIEFQYGELNPENRAHLSVIKRLEKEGASKGLVRGYLGPKDKDKDKDKDKEEGGSGGKQKREDVKVDLTKGSQDLKHAFELIWKEYPKKVGKAEAWFRFRKEIHSEAILGEIWKAFQNYRNSRRVKDGYTVDGGKWFNPSFWRDWIEYTEPHPQDKEKDEIKRMEESHERANEIRRRSKLTRR